ncbi:MAG: PKD domain-containing protein [Brumimicrobium sp.]|nr:PKD domain-containing protein [Brumimicrobium sp.]
MKRVTTAIIILLLYFVSYSQEICNNGIDDDGDGLIDLNDPDCDCNGFGNSTNIPSLIPNPSFEDRNCCPTSFSQLNCAQTWMQATSATSDYFACGYSFGAANQAGISAADGSAYIGAIFQNGWREYVGSCLLSPLLAGETYVLDFNIASFPITGMGGVCNNGTINYGDVDISIFGTTDCSYLPVSTTDCPSNASPNWNLIGSQTYSPSNSWSVLTITFTPTVDIYAIMIGAPCSLPAAYNGSPCYAYFVFDNLILQAEDYFNSLSITETGNYCTNDLTLHATADSLGGTWQWYFEGVAIVGQTGPDLNLAINGMGDGVYNALYTLGSNCGVANYTVNSVVQLHPDFTSTIECQGVATSFANTSTSSGDPISMWSWDFDNNGVIDDNGQNVSYVFPTSGTHNVSLQITSSTGCQHDTVIQVVVNPNPVVDFTWGDVCIGNSVVFNNGTTISSGSIASWSWDFGDGSTGTSQNESHLYSSSGSFNVTLQATSNQNCVDQITKTVNVYPQPSADFNFVNACTNEPISLTSTSTSSAGGFSHYYWDVNNDGIDEFTTQNTQYSYNQAGQYPVRLIVEDFNGCRDTIIQQVTSYALPHADYTATFVCEDDITSFTNTSMINPVDNDMISTYAWSFGDGNTSNQENPTHGYGVENVYTAQLVITTNYGCKDSISKPVEVYPLPHVNFSPTDVCLNFTTNFTDQSIISNTHTSNSNVQWSWDFADGTTSTLQNPTHVYGTDGTYNATLTVTSNHGCENNTTLVVTVHSLPIVSFSGQNLEGCAPLCPVITSTSTINAPSTLNQFIWTLSDGRTYTGNSFSDCYENTSGFDISYGVNLEVISNFGCTQNTTVNDYIQVYHNPIAGFYYLPENPDILNSEVEFHNTSLYANSYIWTIDNIGNMNEFEPKIDFPYEPVKYGVMLVAYTDKGCVDTARSVVNIRDKVIFYVPNTFTPDNDHFNETFQPVFSSGFDPQTYTLLIFNRWGEIIFESHDVNVGWRGTYGIDSNIPVKDGTYVWKIMFKETMTDKHHTYTGHVNILR